MGFFAGPPWCPPPPVTTALWFAGLRFTGPYKYGSLDCVTARGWVALGGWRWFLIDAKHAALRWADSRRHRLRYPHGLWALMVIGSLMGLFLSGLSLGAFSSWVVHMVSCGVSYGLFSKRGGLFLTDTYGHIWKRIVTYMRSDFCKLLLWSHTNTCVPVWISMVTYGLSNFRRLLMVVYGYLRAHTNAYGNLHAPRPPQAALMVTYKHIWANMGKYGYLWLF